MFDVHAHLTDQDLLGRLPEVLGSASDAGVTDVMVVSEDLHDAAAVLSLGGELSGVRLHKAVGMHPEKADLGSLPTVLEYIRAHVHCLACVGEIGLDYSPHVLGDNPESTKALQQAVFKEQVRLAMELGLAVNVHSRSAGHHTIEMLKELGATKVVMHAFDGRAHYAEQGAALGYFFSVPPCVVRSPLMQKWVKRLPLDKLLLETDSPALAPGKGETNEPKNLTVSCAQIAALKGMSVEEVKVATAANARRLFGLDGCGES